MGGIAGTAIFRTARQAGGTKARDSRGDFAFRIRAQAQGQCAGTCSGMAMCLYRYVSSALPMRVPLGIRVCSLPCSVLGLSVLWFWLVLEPGFLSIQRGTHAPGWISIWLRRCPASVSTNNNNNKGGPSCSLLLPHQGETNKNPIKVSHKQGKSNPRSSSKTHQ